MLVKEVRSYGETIARFKPDTIAAIASPHAIRDAQSALAGVVEAGTGRLIMKGAPYTAVAKTGSAQQVIESGRGYRYSDGSLDMLCSFTGYFPVENPKYSCIVAIKAHERRGGKRLYGATVAGPVFRAVADRVYARTIELHDKNYGPERRLPSEEQLKGGRIDEVRYVTQELSLPWSIDDGGEGWWAYKDAEVAPIVQLRDSVATEQSITDMITVPSVIGMGLKDAIWILENAGLKVMFTGMGRVTAQSSVEGSQAEAGSTIKLTMDN
jgi:cell division protein FtsI (penicillin-binding protein 3)